LHGKNKIQNKQISVLSIKWCVQVVEIVEMDDEELYVPDDILEEASAARYQMLPKKSHLRYQKELEKFTSE
jgi:1,2-phenylacetyl-CoA epoxidase PaaB subunit